MFYVLLMQYMQDLGSSAARCESSSLSARTVKEKAESDDSAFLFIMSRSKIS